MKVKTPEVGDVWNFGRDMYIAEIYDNSTAAVCLIKDNYGFALEKYDVKFLQKYGVYLGKSKASIRDLFEVKSNEEYITLFHALEKEALEEKIEFAKEAVDLFFKTEDESKLLEIAEWE